VKGTLRTLRDLLLPPLPCSTCGRPSRGGPFAGMCRTCWRERRRAAGVRCIHCGVVLPSTVGEDSPLCGACLAEPPAYESHVSRFLYEGPVRRMVLAYKEGRRYPLADLLGRAVAREVQQAWPEQRFDAVVAVPSPLRRRMVRGFEPAGLVGQGAARSLRIPFERALVLRKTPLPQKGLTRVQRRENVRAAFAVRRPVKGKTLLLVDDVTTTGATLNAAAAALARAGATVYAATFAQTPLRSLDLFGADEGRETRDEATLGGPPSTVGR